MHHHEQELTVWAQKVCPQPNRNWFDERLAGIVATRQSDLAMLFSAAGRKAADGSVEHSLRKASDLSLPVDTSNWSAQDLLRVAGLVVASIHFPDDEQSPLLEDLFFRGSAQEKRAVLLGLPLVEHPEQHLALAVEACRTNTIPVFSAIACENAYPAAHFSELSFNQLVLKTIFLDLEVVRIVGIKDRFTPTLKDNLRDFRAEREAAGRSVPDGLNWLLKKA